MDVPVEGNVWGPLIGPVGPTIERTWAGVKGETCISRSNVTLTELALSLLTRLSEPVEMRPVDRGRGDVGPRHDQRQRVTAGGHAVVVAGVSPGVPLSFWSRKLPVTMVVTPLPSWTWKSKSLGFTSLKTKTCSPGRRPRP